jgi:hypothetical protein
MGGHVLESRTSPSEEAAARPLPMQRGGWEMTMLGLQRAAGNAAVGELARSVGSRLPSVVAFGMLDRCGAGACACGGTSRRREAEDELLRDGELALRRAVVARAAADPVRESGTARSMEQRPRRQRLLHRRVTVRNPGANIPNPGGTGVVQTNAATIQAYLQQLCAAGAVTVNAASGAVALSAGFCAAPTNPPGFVGPPAPSGAQASSTPVGCGCLCDMIASGHTWTITVDDAQWPHTSFDDHAKAAQPGVGTGGDVTAPSPNSPNLWGAGTASGGTLDIPPWLVLGHELCGHGWMGDRGAHGADEAQPRGQGGHQETVRRENLIRAEHGIELRGGFKDPNCGESYSRDRASPGTVNWSSFRNICIQWRNAYNTAHGTSYRITDRIP